MNQYDVMLMSTYYVLESNENTSIFITDVTRYCNVIGPHCMVWWDMATIHCPPFFAEVDLACETSFSPTCSRDLFLFRVHSEVLSFASLGTA